MRLLYARVGKTISPISGKEVKRHYVHDVVEKMQEYREGTRLAVMARLQIRSERTPREQLEILMKEGFTRVEVREQFYGIDELREEKKLPLAGELLVLIDR